MTTEEMTAENINPASKEYLEAIFELEEEGKRRLQARISERLGISAPSVSEGIKRLVADGLVTIGEHHDIELTNNGREVAQVLVRRHRLAERLLTDVLGIPWHECHHQAENWEKVMTPEVEEAILQKLTGEPTCPHGNPIPGAESAIPWSDLVSIASMNEGQSGRITRLLEDVELDADVMKYLQDHRLMPGHQVTVLEISPDKTPTVEIDNQKFALGERLAERVWVLAN